MGVSLLFDHPNDEAMLSYLDGELSRARTRSIYNHLKSCWKCRSVLADLESQVETISRLLLLQLDTDIDRSIKAKEKFLRWRRSFEKLRTSSFRTECSLLDAVMRFTRAQSKTAALLRGWGSMSDRERLKSVGLVSLN